MKALDEMKARMNAATSGPWTTVKPQMPQSYRNRIPKWMKVLGRNSEFELKLFAELCSVGTDPEPNAEFIAHSRTDMERLIRAVEVMEYAFVIISDAAKNDGDLCVEEARKAIAEADKILRGEG